MRVVVSVKATPGGGANSQATRYIAYRDRDTEREGAAPRTLFAERADELSFWKAERLLTNGRTPTKQELLHLAVSFREEDFRALGNDEASRQQSLKQVVRAAIPQLAADLNAERLAWVAGIHRNTAHPHVHLLIHHEYVERETGKTNTLDKLPAHTLPHRVADERGERQLQPGSLSQAFADALDRAQERAPLKAQNPELEAEARWLELAERNPSLAGRALTQEIILRGTETGAIDLRAAFVTPSIDDTDYRNQAEHADWLGTKSATLRDWYERGATVNGDVLTIPAEAHELSDERDQPFLSTMSYAHQQIHNVEQAQEFHTLAKAIAGETADARTALEVFRHYYRELKQDEQRTLSEMRLMAGEMAALETRDSIEVQAETVSLEDARDNDEPNGRAFNVAARSIKLTDEALRFPVELSDTTKARLIEHTMPALDRHLETGKDQASLVKAIDATLWERDSAFAQTEVEERQAIGRFLKGYVAERWRDQETRALHRSPAFRAIHEKLNATRTPAELNRAAEAFLRDNLANNALNARERNLLFFGRAPAHHTDEMRELRYAWGLSRAERATRVQALHEGRATASPTLQTMLDELATRRTDPALRHYQAAILNPTMTNPGKLDLHSLYARLPPHERTFLFERIAERKTAFTRNPEQRPMPQPNERISPTRDDSTNTRPLGGLPRASASYHEYLASMGALELRLLNEAVRARTDLHLAFASKSDQQLTITEARALLPREERDRIRAEARNQAWERLAPPDATHGNPSNELLKLNDTLARLQEETQERARLAHQTLQTFTQEHVGEKAIRQLDPTLARQWEDLNRFAVTAREELYRGFETLDVLRRDYELTRQPDVNARELAAAEPTRTVAESLFEKSDDLIDRPTAFLERDAPAFAREDARASEFAQRIGYVESNARWHFDSLRDVAEPNPLRGADIAPDHGYEHRIDYER